MIKIIFNGIGGRIGHTTYKLLLKNPEFSLVAGVDKYASQSDFDIPIYTSFNDIKEEADIIIDFSVPETLESLLEYALDKNLKLVIATTGHTPEQVKTINNASKKLAIFKASNMSLGVNMLASIAKETASFLGTDYDVEIIEQHHNQKIDSPSGTALTLADAINEVRDNSYNYIYGRHNASLRRKPNEIGIHAVRGGSIVGKHDIMYIGSGEVITLSHESQNKEVFVYGSLRAVSFLMDKPTGLYDMNSIIGSLYSVTNVSVENNITLITIPSIKPNKFIAMLEKLGNKNINLDMISQNLNHDDTVSISFTLSDSDNQIAFEELFDLQIQYFSKENTSKITSEGAGMAHQCGVAKDVLNILNLSGANVYSITTSETKISCCIDNKSVVPAEKALKKYYKIK